MQLTGLDVDLAEETRACTSGEESESDNTMRGPRTLVSAHSPGMMTSARCYSGDQDALVLVCDGTMLIVAPWVMMMMKKSGETVRNIQTSVASLSRLAPSSRDWPRPRPPPPRRTLVCLDAACTSVHSSAGSLSPSQPISLDLRLLKPTQRALQRPSSTKEDQGQR